jgi:hypothetical protein
MLKLVKQQHSHIRGKQMLLNSIHFKKLNLVVLMTAAIASGNVIAADKLMAQARYTQLPRQLQKSFKPHKK